MPFTPLLEDLAGRLRAVRFAPPVAYVYLPLDYARAPYEAYLERYGQGRKEVLLVGMNPGPFGMAQTGVPFGEISAVREWLGLEAAVGRPRREHPKRPVLGFACSRSEVSGSRLWGWARRRYGSPQAFFERFMVYNYCPLLFLEESGRNLPPERLRSEDQESLALVCDVALRAAVELWRPAFVVGVGRFAEESARRALAGRDLHIGRILHPSPASPLANRGWAERAEADLVALGIGL